MSDKRANSRIRFLVLGFVAVFAVALGRAAWIQVVDGPGYAAMASRQHRETIEIPAGRGTIYDRTGTPLAIGEQATTVYADPRHVVAPAKAAVKAGAALGLDPDELYPTFRDREKRFVFVERKADPVKAKALQEQGVAGLGFYAEERRSYPQGAVAAHLLGFAGTDNRGLDGLERSLERTLRGRPGYEIVVRDPSGHAIDVVTSRKERPGRNVVLTLDHQLQSSAEQILASAAARWRARGATAIVMDPRTGAILAMANAPTFDANTFTSAPAEARRNRAVTDLYEPGSTFKIVTVAAALEDNVVAPDSSFVLAPTIKVSDRTIREAHTRGTERMTVRQILAQSSNVGTITIAQQLGGPELASWIDRFGFGSTTGSELPGESPGMVLPYERWSGSTIGTVPIGQGIAVTPLQMVSAYAAIGNDGVMAPAHVIAKVGGQEGASWCRASGRLTAHGRPHDGDVPQRRRRGHGHGGGDPGLHRRREDRHREQGRERRLRLEVRRLVRRARPGAQAAPRDSRDGRRATWPDLGRRRRGAPLPRHRAVRPPVPRGPARRAGVAALDGAARGGRHTVGRRADEVRPYNRA